MLRVNALGHRGVVSGQAATFGRETFIKRARDGGMAPDVRCGDCAYIDPDLPAEPAVTVAVEADGPGSDTVVRLMVVEDPRRVVHADGGWSDIVIDHSTTTTRP